MLMQFGGPNFSFPLTEEQLDRSMEDPNRFAFNVLDAETGHLIGHCEVYLLEDCAKLARIIIGNESQRGKGIGTQIIIALIEFVSANLNRPKIELNVFDWNLSAIKCYERVGFRINPDKRLERKVRDQTWIALNMVLDNNAWQDYRRHIPNTKYPITQYPIPKT
jgi:RimJ/RimL family protein N-acetyltransferase